MTNFEYIKEMSVDELAAFLLKVNCSYSEDCMIFSHLCKYPNEDLGCKHCFKDYLEKERMNRKEDSND